MLGKVSTVVVTSALVLVTEIVAARVVAPYVGVTLETFSAVIGCVLGAIAVGNHVGGRLADGAHPRRSLAVSLTIGGVALVLAPSIVHAIGPHLDGRAPTTALILAVTAFALPCGALSTVSPIVIRELGAGASGLGRVAGNVSAAATIGALAGNFGAGYWLIGRFGSTAILTTCGATALALAALVALGPRRQPALAGLVAVSTAGASLAVARVADARPPCTTETTYVCLEIERIGSEAHFRSNGYSSSYTDAADPTDLRLSYARDVAGALNVAAPDAQRFAMIGGGGETLSRYLVATRPGATVHVFEIDAELATAVTATLGPAPAGITTTIGDARLELEKSEERYDVVIGDAFAGLSVPWHLTTVELLTSVRDHLTDDGVYVVNLVDAGGYDFVRAELATLQAVFGEVVVLTPIGATRGDGHGPNVNFVAVAGADLPAAADVEIAARDRGSVSVALDGVALADLVGDARPLRDELAPTDQLVSDR